MDSIISGISLQIEEEDAGLKRLKSYSIKDVQKNIQKFEEDLFRVFSNDLFLQAFVITFSIDEQDAGETHVKRILSELKDPEMIYMTEEPSVYENVLKNFKKVLHENSRNLYHIEVHPKIKQIISMIQQPLSKAAASNPLSRWYHRMRTTWSFENDRHVRLAMDKAINTCVHKINYTMDLLEKSPLDFKGLIKQAKSILISMETVFNKMIDLVEMYNAGMRIQDSNKKLQKQKPLHDEIPIRELASLRRHESDIRGDIKLIEALENKAENISFAMEN